MIYLELNGRTGNQLFRYAFARRLQLLFNEKLVIRYSRAEDEDDSFYYALGDYQIADVMIENTEKELFSQHACLVQKVARRLFRLTCKRKNDTLAEFWRRQEKWQPVISRFGIYKLSRGYADPVFTPFRDKFLDGAFEDKRYFDAIRSVLLEEFQPGYPRKEQNAELYKIIDSREAVCVSVRRGDYTNEKNNASRNVCTLKYYQDAVEQMKEKVNNPVFVFFSDDMDWVRENMRYEGIEAYYETGEDEVWEKLRLMYSCKHFILSNSTFAWWAWYLSRNEQKVAISPKIWFKGEKYKDYQHSLIDDSWILLDV